MDPRETEREHLFLNHPIMLGPACRRECLVDGNRTSLIDNTRHRYEVGPRVYKLILSGWKLMSTVAVTCALLIILSTTTTTTATTTTIIVHVAQMRSKATRAEEHFLV